MDLLPVGSGAKKFLNAEIKHPLGVVGNNGGDALAAQGSRTWLLGWNSSRHENDGTQTFNKELQ